MKRRTPRLYEALDLDPGLEPLPFELLEGEVKRRVNRALDAVPAERSAHMRQKTRRLVLAALAAVLVVAGTALAVSHIDFLSVFFDGGGAEKLEKSVQIPDTTLEKGGLTLSVTGVVADGANAVVGLCFEAGTGEARAALMDPAFPLMNHIYFVKEGELAAGGGSPRDLSQYNTDTRRYYTIWLRQMDNTDGRPLELRFMGEGYDTPCIAIPMDPVDTLTVRPGAGVDYLGDRYTVDQVTLSPLSLTVTYTLSPAWDQGELSLPALSLLFRMSDGTVRTQRELLDGDGLDARLMSGGDEAGGPTYRSTASFPEVIDLADITGVIVGTREYSLADGSSRAVDSAELPRRFEPFRLEVLPMPEGAASGYGLSLEALCGALDARYAWDPAAGAASMAFRDREALFSLGSHVVMLDGGAVTLTDPDGLTLAGDTPAVNPSVIDQLFGTDSFLVFPRPEGAPYWVITP